MKKGVILFLFFSAMASVNASEMFYSTMHQKQEKADSQYSVSAGEKREIKNLAEYFRYLPKEVHRNWTPYKANENYEVTVQFRVHKNGTLSDLKIVESNNIKANASVLNAVKLGEPYQPLPQSYPSDSVTAQVILQYQK